MKKTFLMFCVVASLSACNSSTDDTTIDETDTVVTTSTTETTTSTDTYTSSEGDVSYRNGKLMVWRNNDWVESDSDVTLDNGVIIYRNGEVKRDNTTIKMEDGEVVTRTGRFFDRTGAAIENAWDDTKRGVSKAGKAVGDAVSDAAKDVKDAVDGDKKNN